MTHIRPTNVEFRREPVDPGASVVAESYDYDKILPLNLLRAHTATDDVISVSDELLKLYRKAALEAAAAYTGLPLTGRDVITEDVKPPIGTSPWVHRQPTFVYHAQYQFAEPTIYYYGLRGRSPTTVGVKIHQNEVRLQREFDNFGLGCCNPCDTGSSTARILYVAGYRCEDDFPAAIALGAMKYVAHVIENPGDLTYQLRGPGRLAGSASMEGSNPALASGAIDIWRAALPHSV